MMRDEEDDYGPVCDTQEYSYNDSEESKDIIQHEDVNVSDASAHK